jgi:hypothetical protein
MEGETQGQAPPRPVRFGSPHLGKKKPGKRRSHDSINALHCRQLAAVNSLDGESIFDSAVDTL